MVRLWRLYRGGGMGGGHLPDTGGSLEQSTHTMMCFDILNGATAELDDLFREH
jgi:hypothetical protein